MSFKDEWDEILNATYKVPYKFVPKEEFDIVTTLLRFIFEPMKKLRNGDFYRPKQISTLFSLMQTDIYDLNDLAINSDYIKEIYEVILVSFIKLIDLCDRYEYYEASGNLKAFQEYWFDVVKVKVV